MQYLIYGDVAPLVSPNAQLRRELLSFICVTIVGIDENVTPHIPFFYEDFFVLNVTFLYQSIYFLNPYVTHTLQLLMDAYADTHITAATPLQ